MLRLCFDLPRYSTDFDFYLKKEPSSLPKWSGGVTATLQGLGAELTDQWEKHYTHLWEIRLEGYPRRLKIEVRKENERAKETELGIAHSPYSPLQVRLRVLTLHQMWLNKIAALLDRTEIRDAYDLEFLSLRRAGRFQGLDPLKLKNLDEVLNRFSENDFRVTLASVLGAEERKRVLSSRFSYLKSQVAASLAGGG